MSTWEAAFTTNRDKKRRNLPEIRARHVETWPNFNELSQHYVAQYEG